MCAKQRRHRPACRRSGGAGSVAEVYSLGQDGIFLAFGTMFIDCAKAAEKLRSDGLDVGVVNARFLRPLDLDPIVQTIEQGRIRVTAEENTLNGGFGSAVLEAAHAAGLNTRQIKCLGTPRPVHRTRRTPRTPRRPRVRRRRPADGGPRDGREDTGGVTRYPESSRREPNGTDFSDPTRQRVSAKATFACATLADAF